MRFQDDNGPLGALGVFHDGVLVSPVLDDQDRAYELRNRMASDHPGCEVLAICLKHPDTAAVDCLTCWPLDAEDPP